MDLELYEQHGTLPAIDGVPLFYGRAGMETDGIPLLLNDGIGCDGAALCDMTHNLVVPREGGWLHRKGAPDDLMAAMMAGMSKQQPQFKD